MSKSFFLLLFTILSWLNLTGQTVGLEMKTGVNRIDIPFEYKNNFIIVDLVFNKSLPLKFIFDTGAEYTIINKREITDIFNISYEKEFKILGSDMETELIAYLARGVTLDLNKLHGSHQDILILAEDYFRIEDYTGIDIHGIIGANFFKRYVIKIDYHRKVLSFIKPEIFHKIPAGYQEVPAHFKRNKPYLHIQTEVTADSVAQLNMLVDSGASLAMLIHSNTHPKINMPEHTIEGNLAMGLGGFIKGFLGRTHQIKLNETLHFQNVLTNFQKITAEQDTTHLNSRNGVIGNLILKRFTVLIDYPHEKVYLKPKRKYNRGFKYDKSGLGFIAAGKNLNRFVIHNVVKGSPADLAGIEEGDEIIRINLFGSSFYTLGSLNSLLKGREGKRIRMIIRRNGVRKKVIFRLKTLI